MKEISLEKCKRLAKSIEESRSPKVGLNTQLLGFNPKVFSNEYFYCLEDFDRHRCSSVFIGGKCPTLVIPYRRGVQLVVHSSIPLFYVTDEEAGSKLATKLNKVRVHIAHAEMRGSFFLPEKEDVLHVSRLIAGGNYSSAIQKMQQAIKELI